MQIAFLGDIVGRSGREAVLVAIKQLETESGKIDCIIANGENAAHGFGLNAKVIEELMGGGIHAITTGNHVWDQKELISAIDKYPNVIRPINFPAGTPGKGIAEIPVGGTFDAGVVVVINVMLRLFMDALDDPFAAVDKALERYRLGKNGVKAIVVDMHGEASSEKTAMGHYLDGRVSLVVGTHTHIPTADGRVLNGGTAYQTDAGMCGDYDSVIGMDKKVPILKFTRKMPTDRMTPADGIGTACGLVMTVNPKTGLATTIRPIRLGGCLLQAS